jgi:hypothetical protein
MALERRSRQPLGGAIWHRVGVPQPTASRLVISILLSSLLIQKASASYVWDPRSFSKPKIHNELVDDGGSTGKGILIGVLSALGSAAFVAMIAAIIYFFRYTAQGRILLDRMGRPGEYDDEQAFLRDEAEALETMDDLTRFEYFRAKGLSLCGRIPS